MLKPLKETANSKKKSIVVPKETIANRKNCDPRHRRTHGRIITLLPGQKVTIIAKKWADTVGEED